MLPDLQYAAIRYENLVSQVLLPAAFAERVPLAVTVWQTPDRVKPSVAIAQAFEPVNVGWRWGPVWSTAWFRVAGTLPTSMDGKQVALRFSSGTEALLWKDGVPFQGFDPYRDLAVLWERAPAGESVDLLIEAACNMPLGVSTFWWDHPEVHARWREPNPGRLEQAELVVFDRTVWKFAQGFDTARKVLLTLPPTDARAHQLDRGLRALLARLPDSTGVRAACAGLQPELAELLAGAGAQTPVVCTAVGHAHIDTAWLWPLAETERKCLRTFANVLRLQEQYPHMQFLCSQAQQYAWVEERSPELFAQITQRVQQGRWEPGGAMWVEPDCTCPSGESFIRQILHGTRWWQSRFGGHAAQRFLYLPDTFGFPASLPQIMAQAGLDTFITNKMSWCESNRFPNVTFVWRGLDGSEVLSHFTPGHNYNSSLEPKDFQLAVENLVQQDGALIPAYLQPFGWGDGGGGPTAEQVERADIGARCQGLPRVEQGRVDNFCQQLHNARSALQRAGQDVRVWDGELYLELHRGTYTSQAWIKQANRKAELDLRLAEMLEASRLQSGGAPDSDMRQQYDAAWKTVLLNQFHDILPGSSIGQVYDDARVQMSAVNRTSLRGIQRGMAWLGDDAKGGAGVAVTERMVVFNSASTTQSGVLPTQAGPVWVENVPPLGVRVVDVSGPSSMPPAVSVEGERTLRNEHLQVTVDDAGRIALLRRQGDGWIANQVDASGQLLPMNQLVLYDDRPRRWEAWDVDRDYHERSTRAIGRAELIQCEQSSPAQASIVVERALGKRSRIVQRYTLTAACPRVDILTDVEWDEESALLRTLFPCAVRARAATFGIQFGCLERSTHDNTSWDRAQFEVPGHNWMDLSQPGAGVAVLDNGKFGRSARHGVLGLSLLRAPNFPDPRADRGHHRFCYSVMVHAGNWRAAGVDAQAEQLNNPLIGAVHSGGVADGWQAVDVRTQGSACLQVAALKPAEDGQGVVLRVVEVQGGAGTASVRWGFPAPHAVACDVLERQSGAGAACAMPVAFAHDAAARTTTFAVRPFQITTILVHGAQPLGGTSA